MRASYITVFRGMADHAMLGSEQQFKPGGLTHYDL
jgi:hypothetical protein